MGKTTQPRDVRVERTVAKQPAKDVTAAIKTLVQGVKLATDNVLSVAETSSKAVIETAARLASVPALKGMTEATYNTRLAPAIAEQVARLPVASKAVYASWAKSLILGACHGLTPKSNGLEAGAKELREALKASGVIAKVTQGAKRKPGGKTNVQTPQGDIPANGNQPKVVTRTAYDQAAFTLAGGDGELYALAKLAFTVGNRDQTRKLLKGAFAPNA